MSLKTWKKEFYPIPASEVEGRTEAIQHSLVKWVGLRGENLRKHNVRLIGISLTDARAGERLDISSDSCALCHLYLRTSGSRCGKCPLVTVRNKYPCDIRIPQEGLSPFHYFALEGNPEPMIELLEKVLEMKT